MELIQVIMEHQNVVNAQLEIIQTNIKRDVYLVQLDIIQKKELSNVQNAKEELIRRMVQLHVFLVHQDIFQKKVLQNV